MEYTIVFCPTVAFAAVKKLFATPFPVHVPPKGVGLFCTFKSNGLASTHTGKSFPAFAIVGTITVIVVTSLFEQKFPSVKLYVS